MFILRGGALYPRISRPLDTGRPRYCSEAVVCWFSFSLTTLELQVGVVAAGRLRSCQISRSTVKHFDYWLGSEGEGSTAAGYERLAKGEQWSARYGGECR